MTGKIKLRAKTSQVETKRTIQRITNTTVWFFEKTNQINNSLARLIGEHIESIQVNKIINGKGDLKTDTKEIKKNIYIRSYYKQLYSTNL